MCHGRTIENRGDKIPGESGFFLKVRHVCDIWGIRIIGPRLQFLRARHGPDLQEEGFELVKGGYLEVEKRSMSPWERRDCHCL